MPRTGSERQNAECRRVLPSTPVVWLAVSLVVSLGAALRGCRLGEAPGGYLAFNEGFYIDAARRQSGAGLFGWFVNPIEYNKTPLFTGVLTMLFKLHLPQVAAARSVSVMAGVCTIVLTFVLARFFYDDAVALAAAVFMAFMPGVVLIDHNIQVDPLMLVLMLGGVCGYLFSLRSGRLWHAALGGCVLGLAILTKETAVLALLAIAVWQMWCARGLRWAATKRFWLFAGPALALGLSWFAYQLAVAPGRLLGATGTLLGRPEATYVGLAFWSDTLLSELPWMLFPLTALVAAVGLCYAAWKRGAGDRLVLVFVGVFFAAYVFSHFHSYYLLPLAPFMALAIARALGVASRRIGLGASAAIVVLLAVLMVFGTVMTMTGQKWGRWSPMTFDPRPDVGYSSVHVYYDPRLAGVFGSTFNLMDGRLRATSATPSGFYAAPQQAGVENLLLSGIYQRSDGTIVRPLRPLIETWLRPVIFGYAIGQTTPEDSSGGRLYAAQLMKNAQWSAEHVGPWWRFGVLSVPVESGVYEYDKASLSSP